MASSNCLRWWIDCFNCWISHIFNSTDKGMSMDKATKYALQLRVIAQESYPNVESSCCANWIMASSNCLRWWIDCFNCWISKRNFSTRITHIFNSTDKGMSMDKATKYALQLRVIAQESYPNDQEPCLDE
jgi:hypothetical protein